MDTIDKAALASMMGEKDLLRPQPLTLPIVRLQGTKGVFVRLDVLSGGGLDKPREIGQVIEGTIVRVRMQLSEYSKDYQRSSNEYDTPKDTVRIWESVKGVRSELASGDPKTLREQFQGLRSRRILYMVTKGGELLKFVVKGKGLTHLFEYFHELQTSGQHLFDVLTSVQPAQEKNEGGLEYWAPHFETVAPLTDKEAVIAANHLKAVHDNLAALKEAYAVTPDAPVPAGKVDVADLPVIDLDEEAPDGSDDEIPF